MPVMSTKASTTAENVELQNGVDESESEPKPQINVQVAETMVYAYVYSNHCSVACRYQELIFNDNIIARV